MTPAPAAGVPVDDIYETMRMQGFVAHVEEVIDVVPVLKGGRIDLRLLLIRRLLVGTNHLPEFGPGFGHQPAAGVDLGDNEPHSRSDADCPTELFALREALHHEPGDAADENGGDADEPRLEDEVADIPAQAHGDE